MTGAGLIRSGWWVLAAAALVSAIAFAVFFRLPPDGSASHTETFSTQPCLIEPEAIIRAMAPDALTALFMPATMTPDDVAAANETQRGKLLVSSDRVVGVVFNGEARAYPLRLLRWHEVVNDVVGGRPIAVTYSPLSGAVAVWDRTVAGQPVELGVSGRLFNSNTLLYDRHPGGVQGSLWHQLTGEAIAGPALGATLQPLPMALVTWSAWTREQPGTTVMAPDPASAPLYRRDPYHSYRGSDLLRFPVTPLPPPGPLARKSPVAIITVGDTDTVFALGDLAEAAGAPSGSRQADLDRRSYLVSFDAEAGAVSVAPRDDGSPQPALRVAYWFAWYSLHPETVPLP